MSFLETPAKAVQLSNDRTALIHKRAFNLEPTRTNTGCCISKTIGPFRGQRQARALSLIEFRVRLKALPARVLQAPQEERIGSAPLRQASTFLQPCYTFFSLTLPT